jgi:hypothetical protein
MSAATIGVVTEGLETSEEWAQLVATCGYNVYATTIHEALPPHTAHLWLVILDPRTAPNRVAMWLRHIRERVVLVTPHVRAGQSLAHWVPALSLVCMPSHARNGMSDVLALAESISSGLITLSMPSQVHSCSH